MTTNILGVDYGHKRVGLALAAQGQAPRRLTTLPGGEELADRLVEVVAEYDVATVVVGLPRNLEGEDTAQTGVVRAFIAELEAHLPDVAIVTQDEAVTSELARQRLGEHNDSKDGLVDQEAAVIILEDYLRAQ